MKPTTILIPVFVADYKVFVLAARIVRKEHGPDAPDVIALIQLQLSNCTPAGVAKDYFDYIGDAAARRRVRLPTRRTSQEPNVKSAGRLSRLRLARPADISRN